jgi:hypothetical protein
VGPSDFQPFGPHKNFIIFPGADYKCLVVERLESYYLFREILSAETCSVRLYSTGKEYCNREVCNGNVTSLVDEVRGEQTGMELAKRRIKGDERKTRIDEENE